MTATSDAERAAPSLTYRHNVLNGIADWLATRSRTAWASQFGYSGLMLSLSNDLREIDVDLSGAAKLPDLPIDFKQAADQGGLADALHPATAGLVHRFARALAEKLAAAEKKYGYSDGWLQADWMDECRAKLLEHVAKGDPRDVAAYCAFLWHHGEKTGTARELDPEVFLDSGLADVQDESGINNYYSKAAVLECIAYALAAAPTLLGVADGDAVGGAFHIGGKYNWKGQPERLVYMGRNWSGNGFWNQFAKVEYPTIVWCEVLDADLKHFEETQP